MKKLSLITAVALIASATNSFAGNKATNDLKLLKVGTYKFSAESPVNGDRCLTLFGSKPIVQFNGISLHVNSLPVALYINSNFPDDPAEVDYKGHLSQDCHYHTESLTALNLLTVNEKFICKTKAGPQVMYTHLTHLHVVSNSELVIDIQTDNQPTISCDYLLESTLK